MEALKPGDPVWVGKYRLLGRLGSGGMGQVFLGQSPGGRRVAVKMVRPEFGGDPEFRARFAREVWSARNVSGLFTAPVVDADTDAARPWLVTAYVRGPSLAAAVEENGPLPARAVLALAGGLAEGLAAIHSKGVIHRDLKPSNVLLADDGPRIIDFGISRAANSTALTRTNLVVGSPGFMSPEQAQGRETGPPSDIFCLGAVLVFAATGHGPFGSGTSHSLMYRVVYGPPALDKLTPELHSLARRCLGKDPARRPTAEQILTELGGAQGGVSWAPLGRPHAMPRLTTPPRNSTAPDVLPRLPMPHPGRATGTPPAADSAALADQTGRDGTADPTELLGVAGAPRRVGQPPPQRRTRRRSPGPARTWRSPGPARDRRSPGPARDRQGSQGPAHTRRRSPGPARDRQGSTGRPPSWRGWLAALLPSAGAATLAAALLLSARQPAQPRARPRSSRMVVTEYLTAINRRRWGDAWRLGGRNLDRSYRQLRERYRTTIRVSLISALHAHDSYVQAHVTAHYADGSARKYLLVFRVRDGVIAAEHAVPMGGP